MILSRGMGICGVGAVTGYGWGKEQLWDGLVSGKTAARHEAGFGVDGEEAGWVALVPDGGDPADGRGIYARAMRAAAREAVVDATARGWKPGKRVGLVHGIVLDEVYLWKDFYLKDNRDLRVRDYLNLMPSTPVSGVMQEFGFHGPAMFASAMCATGNAGLLIAQWWLDSGMADDVVFVATEAAVTPENVEHFVRLGVVVTDREPLDGCRPFQEGSGGFIMAEGSAAMVLSNREGEPYARVLGGAMSHDAYHATSIDPALTDVRRCFKEALDNAGVSAADVRYVNAHGPGTAQCDAAEATVVDELFPPEVGMFSLKPLVGHCLAAASSVEIAVTALGYERGVVPAPPRVAAAHPRLLHGSIPIEQGLTVKSSMGMGGHNSVAVLAAP